MTAAHLRLPDKYAGMNDTEREWALTLEANLRGALDGELRVIAWHYESVRFRLANRTWYLPDFYVLYSDGHAEIHEVKRPYRRSKSGQGWKTSIVKFKTCAEKFSEYTWVVCERHPDGRWTQTRAEDLFKRS